MNEPQAPDTPPMLGRKRNAAHRDYPMHDYIGRRPGSRRRIDPNPVRIKRPATEDINTSWNKKPKYSGSFTGAPRIRS